MGLLSVSITKISNNHNTHLLSKNGKLIPDTKNLLSSLGAKKDYDLQSCADLGILQSFSNGFICHK